MNVPTLVVRVPVVVLTVLVALGAALGLGTGTARAATGDQEWGFVDAPTAVEPGWQAPLTVSWRNFSGEEQTYGVTLAGPGVDWQGEVVVPAEENAFSREVAVPRLDAVGTYRAELRLRGSDEVLAFADVRVGPAPRIVGFETSTRSIAPAGRSAERRAVTTFGVDSTAGVTGRIVDAAGRTVLSRSFGAHEAGERMRWTWAAQDKSGTLVPAGRYTMRLTASDAGVRTSRAMTLRVVR